MSQQNARQRKIFLSELQSRRINVRSVGWMSPTEGVCHQRTVFISAAYTVAPPKKKWRLNAHHFCYGYPLPVLHQLLSMPFLPPSLWDIKGEPCTHREVWAAFPFSSISHPFSEGRWVTDCLIMPQLHPSYRNRGKKSDRILRAQTGLNGPDQPPSGLAVAEDIPLGSRWMSSV